MGDQGVGLDYSYVAFVHQIIGFMRSLNNWFYEDLIGEETPEVMPGSMLKKEKG